MAATPETTPALPAPVGGGRYRFIRELGVGGMATVYEAIDDRLDRVRAIKVMHPHLTRSKELVARHMAEAKALAKLEGHPNVLRVYDVGVEDGKYYIVMELVDGMNVAEMMFFRGGGKVQAKFLVREAVDTMHAVLSALRAAHELGMVHRDVKTQNVMLTKDGRVLVMDFGIALFADSTLTKTSVVMGGFTTSPPEQLMSAKNVDQTADIYACGVMLYHMLSADLETTEFYKKVRDDGRMSSVPPPFVTVFRRACAERPEDRYQNVEEMVAGIDDAMRAYLAMTPTNAALDPPEPQVAPKLERPAAQVIRLSPEAAAPTAVPEAVEDRPEPPEAIASRVTMPPESIKGDISEDPFADPPEVRSRSPRWLIPAAVAVVLAVGAGAWSWRTSPEAAPDPAVTQVAVAAPMPVIDPEPETSMAVDEDDRVLDTSVPDVGTTVLTSADLVPAPAVAASTPMPATVALSATPAAIEAQPSVQPSEAKLLKPKAVKPKAAAKPVTHTARSADGSIVFTATLTPSDDAARLLVRYKVGTSPWKKLAMRQGAPGTYTATLTVDETMKDGVRYVVEASRDGAEPLRDGSMDVPYTIVP
ncbi:protein kinase [Candidatus Uhrbacteria bacterium]|nr:protein kinase [Candidatus Uhrbacteria bacterium]